MHRAAFLCAVILGLAANGAASAPVVDSVAHLQFSTHDQEKLDTLTARVAQVLPRGAHVPGDVRRKLQVAFPRLSPVEIEALTAYVSLELANTRHSGVRFDESYLQLQMAMDRRSKLSETIGNVLKSMEDTDKNIIDNIK